MEGDNMVDFKGTSTQLNELCSVNVIVPSQMIFNQQQNV